ncbi:MAG: hypothetical protein IJ787_07375, partial [Bacilli bacterium]|nr:hypothetical protein [Bacilli bacterium]
MKKKLLFTALAALTLSLASCGGGEPSPATPASPQEQSQTEPTTPAGSKEQSEQSNPVNPEIYSI